MRHHVRPLAHSCQTQQTNIHQWTPLKIVSIPLRRLLFGYGHEFWYDSHDRNLKSIGQFFGSSRVTKFRFRELPEVVADCNTGISPYTREAHVPNATNLTYLKSDEIITFRRRAE